jgi:hypothetical protein
VSVQRGPSPDCLRCRHYKGIAAGVGHVCVAFGKDQSIPIQIMTNAASHSALFPGDHGLRFEPAPERFSEDWVLDNFYPEAAPVALPRGPAWHSPLPRVDPIAARYQPLYGRAGRARGDRGGAARILLERVRNSPPTLSRGYRSRRGRSSDRSTRTAGIADGAETAFFQGRGPRRRLHDPVREADEADATPWPSALMAAMPGSTNAGGSGGATA